MIVSGLRHALAEAGHRASTTVAGATLGAMRPERPGPERPGGAPVYQMQRPSAKARGAAIRRRRQGLGKRHRALPKPRRSMLALKRWMILALKKVPTHRLVLCQIRCRIQSRIQCRTLAQRRQKRFPWAPPVVSCMRIISLRKRQMGL